MKFPLIVLGVILWCSRMLAAQPAATSKVFQQNYDVSSYDLQVKVLPAEQAIEGSVTVHFTVIEKLFRLQLDLVSSYTIKQVTYQGKPVIFKRVDEAVYVDFPEPLPQGSRTSIRIDYHGKPPLTQNAPVEAGIDWRQNLSSQHWITVCPQAVGGRIWWPCKDDPTDRADSMRISVAVPKELVAVTSGTLQQVAVNRPSGFRTYTWHVSYPIQTHQVTLSISNYERLHDVYTSAYGPKLELDYFVLPANATKARLHFKQVSTLLNAYEKFFGLYPLGKNGYKIVDTPYQHTAPPGLIPYANFYRNLPEYEFDPVIAEATARTYVGNSIFVSEPASRWIPEAFAAYAQALLVEETKGAEWSIRFLDELKKQITHETSLLETTQPQQAARGAWTLHTLRSVVNNDLLWFRTLRMLTSRFAYQSLDTETLVRFFSQELNLDCTPFFNQYLFQKNPPVLEFKGIENPKRYKITFRWRTPVSGFRMPVRVTFGSYYETLQPTTEWQTVTLKKDDGTQFKIDTEHFYVFGSRLPMD